MPEENITEKLKNASEKLDNLVQEIEEKEVCPKTEEMKKKRMMIIGIVVAVLATMFFLKWMKSMNMNKEK